MDRLSTVFSGLLLGLTAACHCLTATPGVGAGTYRLDVDALREALESKATPEDRADPDFDRNLAACSRVRDSLELRIDSSYVRVSVLPDGPDSDAPPTVTAGTWSVGDGALTLRQDDGHEFTLRITGDDLEFDEPASSLGVTLRFVRSEEVPAEKDS